MKNKRTKFTALLLSALMAVSTISSVTWAADLFSDGGDGTEVVNSEIVADVEDEIVAEDQGLTAANLSTSVGAKVKFYVDSAGNVVANYTMKSKTYTNVKVELASSKKPATCFFPERALYSATFSVGNETYTVLSDGTGADSGLVELDPSCYQWKDVSGNTYDINDPSIVYEFDWDGKHFEGVYSESNYTNNKGYIITPYAQALGGKYGHSNPTLRKHQVQPATCIQTGIEYNYYGCEWCEEGVFNYNTRKYEEKPDLSTPEKAQKYFDSIGAQKSIVPKNNHNFEGLQPVALTDSNFIYAVNNVEEGSTTYTHKYAVANGEAVRINPSSIVANYELESGGQLLDYAPFNCIGTEIADPENDRDAFYYTYVVCKNCNKVVQIKEKVYLKNTSSSIDGDYYEEVDGGNVLGFLAKRGSKDAVSISGDHNYGYINTYISLAKEGRIKTNDTRLLSPLVPVLSDCGKNGYYYIRTYVKDTPDPVSTKRITVDRISHVWGSTEVAPYGTKYADGKLSATQDAKLLSSTDENLTESDLKYLSNNFVVVRDANGNVIEAKSKNCITTANYELYHQCLICGAKVKTEAKTAQFNTDRHWWPDWSTTTDDEDNKYYQIEGPEHDTYHMKYTYYHRICNWCGKRATQLANEVKEPHQLVEQNFDDDYDKDGKDSTLVEPNCGVDGHYDVILRCACRYEDDQSVKQASIPATDKHDFGENEIVVNIIGDVHVGNNGNPNSKKGDNPYVVYAEVGRICNVCEKLDSNGINNTASGKVGVDEDLIIDTVREGRTIEVTEPKKDENGIPYPCSVGTAKITFNWSGKLNGKAVKAEPVTKTVPYYPNLAAYTGRRDHVYDFRYEELVKPTATQEGSRVKVTFCTVCGEEFRETETLPKLGSAPAVKATPVNYNTV